MKRLLSVAVVALVSTSALASLAATSVLAASPDGTGGGREITVVVDTSRSMRQQDSRRYTVQLLRILADLVASEDTLTVIRMPSRDQCSAGPDPSLVLRLDASDRRSFEQALDHHLAFDTGTYFASSLRTAVAALDASAAQRRLLLVLADAGGLGRCAGDLSRELLAAKHRGLQLAAVHLGRGNGAFDGHPAFESTAVARDAEELMAAVAVIYQRFLGVKQVQSGRVEGGRIEAVVAPHVERAFLVVAADGEVGPVRPATSRPALSDLDDDFRGGGATLGLDGKSRSYRIVRLERPESGDWRFELPRLGDVAGWMLVQESALGVRVVSQETWVAEQPARLIVEVYDRSTGQRVTNGASLPGLDLTLEGGVRLRDDGTRGDGRANDGLYTAELRSAREGAITVRLSSELFDQSFTVTPKVGRGLLELEAPGPLNFGLLEAGDSSEAVLDLSSSKVIGSWRVRLGSDLEARRVSLEIDAGNGFEPLDGADLELTPSRLRFPLRVRVASCPEAVGGDSEAPRWLWLEGGGDRIPQRAEVSLGLQVVTEPWLVCWWPMLAIGAGGLALVVVAHGWLTPTRFPPRAGLQLAQDEALGDGFFHPFRAQPGARSGFYRDARLFLHPDFRLSSRAVGALARVRARSSGVALLPLGELWRRSADGKWEQLETAERRLRPGVMHRAGHVYFELRNG